MIARFNAFTASGSAKSMDSSPRSLTATNGFNRGRLSVSFLKSYLPLCLLRECTGRDMYHNELTCARKVTMANLATLYRFKLSVSDVDRGVYEDLDFRVPMHPSENAAYLLSRVLAYALNY